MPTNENAEGATVWSEPPAALKLEADTVHLWRCAEDLPAARLAEVAGALNAEERSRAQQYRFEPDRQRFVLCRGILRNLLGRYLGCSAQSVQFGRGAHGKPELAGERRTGSQLQFNLSHTRGMCLIGFAQGHSIGVDVEAVDPKRDWSMLARRFLHPGEWEMISSLPMEKRASAFYDCWTCKEAYLKARGDGLSRGLTTFQVILPAGPGEVELIDQLSETADGEPAEILWWLKRLYMTPNCAAAVACRRRPLEWHCFEYL